MTTTTDTSSHAELVVALTGAWDDWEARPNAATPLFARNDLLRTVAERLVGRGDATATAAAADRLRAGITARRRRRMPTADAVYEAARAMARADGSPGP